ncbi:MAG: adenosine deaminase [bacterium]|nr:adenosine deaminase [bacterium]
MVDATELPYIAALPKVELHVHLETSLRLRRLLQRRDPDHPLIGQVHLISDPSRFAGYDRLRRLRYAERGNRLPDAAYTRANIAAITAELIAEASGQSVRHIEVRVGGQRAFSVLGVRGMLEAMAEGAGEARRLGLSYGTIVTVIRERGPEEADRIIAEAAAASGCAVVGVDLAGDEENYPAGLFSAPIARARDAGLGITVHAGEFAGPAGVWAAVYQLGAARIGHGIRSIEDPALLDRLRERGVALEICPTSNVRLGLVSAMSTHPVGAFLDQGVPVTINSDDPVLLGTTLTGELAGIARAHRLSREILVNLQVTAARAAFLPAGERESLERAVRLKT